MFDIEQFKTTQFEDRTDKEPVPELSDWFSEGETPEFTVRALIGPEIAVIRQEAEKRRAAQKIIAEAEHKNYSDTIIAAARIVMGLIDEKIPEEHARYIHIVRLGCLELNGDLDAAVKIGKEYGVVLNRLAMKILELTGSGRAVKKKPPLSSPIPKSETS